MSSSREEKDDKPNHKLHKISQPEFLIMKCGQDSEQIQEVLANKVNYIGLRQALLYMMSLDLLFGEKNIENRKLIASNDEYADRIASGLLKLILSGMLTEENKQSYFTLLCINAKYADHLGDGLWAVKMSKLTPEHKEHCYHLICNHSEYSEDVAYGFIYLQQNALLSGKAGLENFDLLTTRYSFARYLAQVLVEINKVKLLSGEKRLVDLKYLDNEVCHTPIISNALNSLYCQSFYEEDYARDVYILVIESKQYASNVASVLIELKNAGLCTKKNRELLSESPSFAYHISQALCELRNLGLLKGEAGQNNYNLLRDYVVHADSIAGILGIFRMENLDEKQAQNYFHLLCDNVEYSKLIYMHCKQANGKDRNDLLHKIFQYLSKNILTTNADFDKMIKVITTPQPEMKVEVALAASQETLFAKEKVKPNKSFKNLLGSCLPAKR